MHKDIYAKSVAIGATTLVLSAGFSLPAQAAETPNPIDTNSRSAVSEAYKSRWVPTTSGMANWTGNVDTCDKGTQSAESLIKGTAAVNFYRGLSGLDSITLTDAQNQKAQAAALIMEANGTITHYPTADMKCYTDLGSQGAATSNLLLSGYIPSMANVVELYMDDPGTNNLEAGHRRWILNPTTTTMGFGTTRGINAINVVGGGVSQTRAKPEFIPFPNAGYSPQQLEPNGRWSLSASSSTVDFTNATVSVKDSTGKTLSVVKNPVHNGYGPNTLVFQVTGINLATGSATSDYTVTVSNINNNGNIMNYTYTTKLFDGTDAGTVAPTPTPTPTPTPAPTAGPTFKSLSEIAAIDADGVIWNYHDMKAARTKVGGSWGSVETVNLTDWDNDGTVDMLAKAKSGELYLFKGSPTGGFVRSTIGLSGWQDYNIEIAKWKKTDTKPSIIAHHKVTGDIYVYSNPTGTNPVNPVKIGSKFTGYSLDLLDFDKDGNMDMLTRSSATGSMYLYRTNGTGSFYSETRKVIGTGWKDFNSVTTVRNFQGSNTDGLLARDANGTLFYFKTNTDSFSPRIQVGTGWTNYRISNN